MAGRRAIAGHPVIATPAARGIGGPVVFSGDRPHRWSASASGRHKTHRYRVVHTQATVRPPPALEMALFCA